MRLPSDSGWREHIGTTLQGQKSLSARFARVFTAIHNQAMIATLLASGARILYRLIERNGVDPQWVFREAGLDPALLDNPRARFRVENARAAWREAARLIDNPCFGLQAAEAWRPTDFHALGYAFLASQTLRTAIERIVRYNAVVDPVVFFENALDDTQLCLTYRIDRPDLPDIRALEDTRWGVVLGLCRDAYGQGCDPLEVAFTHAAPRARGTTSPSSAARFASTHRSRISSSTAPWSSAPCLPATGNWPAPMMPSCAPTSTNWWPATSSPGSRPPSSTICPLGPPAPRSSPKTSS